MNADQSHQEAAKVLTSLAHTVQDSSSCAAPPPSRSLASPHSDMHSPSPPSSALPMHSPASPSALLAAVAAAAAAQASCSFIVPTMAKHAAAPLSSSSSAHPSISSATPSPLLTVPSATPTPLHSQHPLSHAATPVPSGPFAAAAAAAAAAAPSSPHPSLSLAHALPPMSYASPFFFPGVMASSAPSMMVDPASSAAAAVAATSTSQSAHQALLMQQAMMMQLYNPVSAAHTPALVPSLGHSAAAAAAAVAAAAAAAAAAAPSPAMVPTAGVPPVHSMLQLNALYQQLLSNSMPALPPAQAALLAAIPDPQQRAMLLHHLVQQHQQQQQQQQIQQHPFQHPQQQQQQQYHPHFPPAMMHPSQAAAFGAHHPMLPFAPHAAAAAAAAAAAGAASDPLSRSQLLWRPGSTAQHPASLYFPPAAAAATAAAAAAASAHASSRVKREYGEVEESGDAEATEVERFKRACLSMHQANLEDCVGKYLAGPERVTQRVHIMHPSVAQRSYGHEKRYLCPPPQIMLGGARWREELVACILPHVRVTCDGNTADLSLSDDEKMGLHAVSKSLFIGDQSPARPAAADACYEIVLNDDTQLGVFRSAPITVISKPIKKIRSDRTDMCIKARSQVALFNRVRGQTVSTRYLRVDGAGDTGCSLTSSGWSAFELVPLPADGAQPLSVEQQLSRKSSLLCYGQQFCLRDCITGKTSAPVVLHKVDKSMVVTDCEEPISQLMKVALCVPSASGQYLSVADGSVAFHKAIPHPDMPHHSIISEGAAFTITSTKSVEYTFADMRRPVSGALAALADQVPLSTLPNVQAASLLLRNQSEHVLELRGEGLDGQVIVFLGKRRLEAASMPGHSMVQLFIPTDLMEQAKEGEKDDLPLLLVRRDGVVFPTTFSFSLATHTMSSSAARV